MGISPIKISDGCSYTVNPINPNPSNFKIMKIEQIGNFVLAKIKYPNCVNFEGEKVIVFEGVSVDDIKSKNEIDPHFFCGGSIIARFKPTIRGWDLARNFCKTNGR